MTRCRTLMRAAAALLAVPLAVQGPALAQAVPAATPADPLPHVRALYDGYVARGALPGIVGAFGVGDRPTVFVSAGRIATTPGAAAARPDTLWRIYSMTKPITAMAAMLLIQDGRLTLDEPVATVLPAFAHMRVLTDPDRSLASRPAARPITIRNLLTHTAGLGYGIVTTGPLLKAYDAAGIAPYATNRAVEAKMRPLRPTSLQDFATRVAKLPLIADPGTKWSYSIGLDVLAAVVEKASGEPFERFVQTRLLTPLGMRSTFWQVPAGQAGRLATDYAYLGDTPVPLDPGATSVFLTAPSFPYGGAGLVSSARDYDRFLHMLQDGGTLDGVAVMKPETVRLALSNLLPPGVRFTAPDGRVMGFGAGGFVTLADDPAGAAAGTYGWNGAAGTWGWVDPTRHMRGTIMVNYMPADRLPLREQTVRALLADRASWTR